MSYQSINPFDDKVGPTFKELSDLQLGQVIAMAQSFFLIGRPSHMPNVPSF